MSPQKYSNPSVFPLIFVLFFVLIPVQRKFSAPIRSYKIVIDPGHGGTKQVPYELYGDKYDEMQGKYLENYKSGASSRTRTEMEIVMDIAREVQYLLDLTKTQRGFRKFRARIKKYSRAKASWLQLHSVLSRRDNYADRRYREKDDKNADFRLYDFRDFHIGKHRTGRISRINAEKPYLIVSLHINSSGSKQGSGMGAVLAPSYKTFDLLRRISLGKLPGTAFNQSPWRNWLRFQAGWTTLENAVADAWIYFHGYWPNKQGTKPNLKRFEGYRQNMVTWRYKDANWKKRIGKPGPYAYKHSQFKAVGKFWQRERSNLEYMRRGGGREGFGGDNHYASMELLRFVQYGLRQDIERNTSRYNAPGPILPPYISTYSLPTFTNAITAFLELGDIYSDRDMYFMVAKRKKVAEAIAVGIYSLFYGLQVSQKEIRYAPRGKKIDFNKYITKNGENYFKTVLKN
ncbi:MAG: N-acetylmuramoyl-L-alanine amidase [Spirochaetota bacterium]